MTVTRPAPRAAPPSNGQPAIAARKTFSRSSGIKAGATSAVLIYGTGGIGKSSLAALAPDPLILDLEHGTGKINVDRIDNIESWSELRSFVQTGDFSGVKSIVIDSSSAAEEMCRWYVIENVKTDKGQAVTSLEGFGWGKGYIHLFEEWRRLLADLDRHRGIRNVVIIAHERIGKVPNPNGDDYIRYEPRLYHGPQASILHPTKEWMDEVWFVSYDVSAAEGKARGSGSRTIYVTEQATHMAKTRTLDGSPVIFNRGDNAIWTTLLAKPATDDVPPLE